MRTFRGDAAFASWLHRIAVNVVLMSVRSDKRRQARVTLLEDLQPLTHADVEAKQSRAAGSTGEGVAPRDVDARAAQRRFYG